MSRPFEEQSTVMDVKLPVLKTEGPILPHLFYLATKAARAARLVAKATTQCKSMCASQDCQ